MQVHVIFLSLFVYLDFLSSSNFPKKTYFVIFAKNFCVHLIVFSEDKLHSYIILSYCKCQLSDTK